MKEKYKQNLGFKIPKDYHKKFKNNILEEINQKNTQTLSWYKNPWVISISIAAVLLVGILITKPINTTESSYQDASEEILMKSLVTSDDNIDNLLEDYIVDEFLSEKIFTE